MAASSLLLALAVTAVIGGVATAWLWLVQQPRTEREEGLRLLSAMRWREFSRLVVAALRSRGFEPEAIEDAAERGQDSVIHLRRDGEEWLLACKQGLNYRITPANVSDMTDAVRFHGAAGGVVATPGVTEPAARKVAARVDLIDGDTLWPMVQAQLAPGVRDELAGKARHAATRHIAIAWAGALALGLAGAVVMPKGETADGAPAVAATTTTATAATTAAPSPAANAATTTTATTPVHAAAPISEGEQRDEVIRMVSTLPGVERAMWSTRSTLLVYLIDENANPVRGICDVVEKYESLRTSRLHLQPPAGAARPSRFLQCATY
ncbi:restriction endonuclease [Lysobacter sp. P5_B9]